MFTPHNCCNNSYTIYLAEVKMDIVEFGIYVIFVFKILKKKVVKTQKKSKGFGYIKKNF